MSTPSGPPDAFVPPPQPDTTIPKVLGVLNILFGLVLILCGLGTAVQFVVMPMVGSIAQAEHQKMQAELEAQRAKEIEALKEQIDAAATEEEKGFLRDELEQVEANTIVIGPDMSNMFGMRDPRVMTWAITDVITGLAANLVMIISGVGLLMMRSWGRTLALWIAVLKILRLLVSQTYWALVCVPIVTGGMSEMMKEVAAQAPRAGDPALGSMFGMVYSIMYTAFAIFMVVFGSIYPILCLCLLNTRRVKAAFGRLPPDTPQK